MGRTCYYGVKQQAMKVYGILQHSRKDPDFLAYQYNSEGYYILVPERLPYIEKERSWNWVKDVGAQGDGIILIDKLQLLIRYNLTPEKLQEMVLKWQEWEARCEKDLFSESIVGP